MQKYKHQRIDTKSSEFRLLQIQKSVDEASHTNITLRPAQLDEKGGESNALSYAWGGQNPQHEINIDDGACAHI